MKKGNDKKTEQLGMPVGTASNRLRKSIIYNLVKQLNQHYCFQCGSEIESENELSIEHKIPYLDSDNPKELFFNLDNIAFSHLNCNIGAGRKIYSPCGTHNAYAKGCRCEKCTERQKLNKQKQRQKNKLRQSGVNPLPDT